MHRAALNQVNKSRDIAKVAIMKKPIYQVVTTWSLLCLMSTIGCTSLTGGKNSKNAKDESTWSFFKKKEYQTPHSMNVTWTNDVYTKEGKPPTRGFGGRIYFYNEKSQAVPVEGELIVYGFDDTVQDHSGASMESADKKFRFTPEQFTTHFSESQLGASYSIWIPWDAAPGMQKKIMLIPTFKPKDGPVIRGNAATLLLPGMVPDKEERVIQASANGGVQRASHTTNGAGTSAQGPNRTTTIQLPPRGYQAKPMLTPEQASALLEQFDPNAANNVGISNPMQMAPLNGNTSSAWDNPGMTVTTTTIPASQASTSLPSFHIPAGTVAAAGAQPMLFNGSGLPGFAQASVVAHQPRSEQNQHQAPAGQAAPSFSYPPR
jgi:hypothetical protein